MLFWSPVTTISLIIVITITVSNLKPQWWRATIFCLINPSWWLPFWSSSFNVSLDWFLNLLGFKVLISRLPQVQQVIIGNFRENISQKRLLIWVWNKSFIIELQWTHIIIWPIIVLIFSNYYFIDSFTQNSHQNNINRNNNFCLRNHCWWFQLWPSGLNGSSVWFLNLLGVKVLNLNLPKVQQATIGEFLWKPTEMERTNFFVVKKVDNRTTVDT